MIRTGHYTNASAPQTSVGTSSNNNYMTICHHTSNGNNITITINANAWAAHQAHGDTQGPCSGGNSNSGKFIIPLSIITPPEISGKQSLFWNMLS
jgi:hypothetical protein